MSTTTRKIDVKDIRTKAQRYVDAWQMTCSLLPTSDGSRDPMDDLFDVASAFLEEHPANAPDWYSADEIYHWLGGLRYHDGIAKELAGLIAMNYQLAFNKGFSMGQRAQLNAAAWTCECGKARPS